MEGKYPFYLRLPLILLSAVLIYVILRTANGIFIPLTFSLLFAILLLPLSAFFEKRLHLGKAGSAMLAVSLLIIALSGFVYFLTLQFISFSDDFPMLRKRFNDIFTSFQHWLSSNLHITSFQQTDYLKKSASSIVESVAYSLSNVVFSITGILIWTILIFIFTFFMLYHRKMLKNFMLHLFSAGYRDKVNEVIIETKSMINSYILALLIEMALLSIVICTMFLIMGIKYALLLGMLAAVFNIIPYLGIYSAIIFSMLITFANSASGMAIEVGIGLAIVHLLDSNILMPRLVGGRVKMNPFITILAVLIGEFTWGVSGMFLFIPITGIIKLICDKIEGLEAWSILIGVEENEKKHKTIKVKIEDGKKGQ